MDFEERLGVFDLTPVEKQGSMWFKRDDLYTPFEDIPLSGGKVRQAICLVGNSYEYIRDACNGKIYSGTGLTSPQGIIIARVAKEFGFQSVIFVGNTKLQSLVKNPLVLQALQVQGCSFNYESPQAYENNLSSLIKRKAEQGEKFFHIKFGINLERDPKAILDSVGYQVQNIPDDLDYLIIPCGSCITMAGIIRGLVQYNKHPKKVIGIQIAGMDRTQTLEKILGDDLMKINFELVISKDFPVYSKYERQYLPSGEKLDYLYEAKAYAHMNRHMPEVLDANTLFWVVGNSCPVRDKKISFRFNKQ